MWDVGAGRAGGMIPVPPDLDLQRTLDNDGARETLYAKGGPFVELLARLGAFAHHPAEQTDYHDQKGSGYPRANMRKDRIPLDPTLLALVGDGNVNAREALMVAILLAVGCSKAPAPASGGTGTTASNASTAAVASTAKPVSPRVSPCATDADCSVLLEPCSCSCLALAGGQPTEQEWAAMCAGGHPQNCGAASPCMRVKATCEASTKTCRVAR